MAYLFLALAIIAEVIGTMALKATNGFTVVLPSAIVLVAYGAAFVLLSFCLREIPVGIAYGIWAGIGIVLVTVAGAVIYKQIPDLAAVIGLMLIVAGVTIIHVFSKSTGH
ncbi:SMR family transporter [Nisaea sp.]|uniref:DMT family transporter n=1 Tax=Nisaea sp. TaxID=2024842 RepID=UPI0032EC71E3